MGISDPLVYSLVTLHLPPSHVIITAASVAERNGYAQILVMLVATALM